MPSNPFQLFNDFIRTFGRGYKRGIAALLLGSALAGALELLGVALIYPLIAILKDNSITQTNPYLHAIYVYLELDHPNQLAVVLGFGLVLVFALKNLYMILYNFFQLTFIMKWKNKIVSEMMNCYLHADYQFHVRTNSSKILNTLFSKIPFSINSYVLSVIHIFSYVLIVSFIMLSLLYSFFIPTLIAAVTLTCLMFFQSKIIKRHTRTIDENFNREMEAQWNLLCQAIGAIKETKMGVKESHYLKEFQNINDRTSRSQRLVSFIQLIPTYTTEILLITSIITMAMVIFFFKTDQTNILEGLGVLAVSAFRLAPIMNKILSSYSHMKVSRSSLVEVIQEFKKLKALENAHQLEHFIEYPRLSITEKLSLKNANFTYTDSQQDVLKNLNVDIFKGEFIGIIGTSGAGKTTLIDILMGLLPLTSGTYQVDGVTVDQKTIKGLRKNIGYVHQDLFVLDDSIRKNVAFGYADEDIDDDKVQAALNKAHLTNFVDKVGGLDYKVGENGRMLSGGEKQRLVIARALYSDPEILVLDEATSALDVEIEHAITEMIMELKGSKTIIAIAHRLSTLKKCSRALYMQKGTVIDFDSFENLQSKHPGFARLVELSDIKSNAHGN